jgi:hypothetical protein
MQDTSFLDKITPYFQSYHNLNFITNISSSIQGFLWWLKQLQSDADRSGQYVAVGRSYLIASAVVAQCERALS